MHDLTRFVATADCRTAGCPREADGPDGLCHVCRHLPTGQPDPLPLELKPGELAHLNDDDDDVRPARCRADGCTSPVHYLRGAASGYCHPHGVDRLREIQARGVLTRKASGAYRNGHQRPAKGEITQAAKELVTASSALDRALVAVHQAEQRRDEALDEWRLRLAVLVHTVREQLPAADPADKAA